MSVIIDIADIDLLAFDRHLSKFENIFETVFEVYHGLKEGVLKRETKC
jgi:hypothetical protein